MSRLEFARSRLHLKQPENSIGVMIHPWVKIGVGFEVFSGAVIGHTGFGFERDENGIPVEIVHTGGVVIGDYVRIGENSVVARGTLGDTVIEDHVKIDSLCHIAHNVLVGARTMMASTIDITGSVTVGTDVWIGAHTIIKNKVKIGNHALIGVGAVVIHDVPAGAVVAGNPARILRFQEGFGE
ncbi:MAG: hypothetical protein V2B18_16710 [Pseudomonadota bacterium]